MFKNSRPSAIGLLLLFWGLAPSFGSMAQAAWYGDWAYRTPVAVANPCGEAVEEYAVRLELDSSFDFSKVEADGSDLRLTYGDGATLIPYWIEDWDPGAESGCIWTRLPDLPLGGTTIYLYYGKPGASPYSNALATFEAYDGFENYAVGSIPTGGAVNPGEWGRSPANPQLTEGAAGQWDDHGATFASVIWDAEAGEFRMYYHGFSGSVHQIGLATSASPEGPWTKHAGNPILTPGPAAWDAGSVRVPMVWKEGPGDYRMIYTGAGSGGMRVGYATSADGIGWTKHPANPVFNDPTWASGQTENWGVMKVGSDYLMWYSNFGMRQSGLAVSTDLVNWAPYQAAPIFASNGNPADDRYSQYCPFSFAYGGDYYVLVPSYNSGGNFGKHYLYRSSSPYFPEGDRHLVRVAHTVGADGSWDDHDSDTPCVLTLDIQRNVFYDDQLWCFYAGEGGTDYWKVGLHHETDIAGALADAELPGGQLGWSTTGDVTVVDTPVRQGVRSARLHDTSASAATQLSGTFAPQSAAELGAWMRRSATSVGDFDIYLYGGSALCAVAGLGRNGDFHYWNGAFQPTGVTWLPGTWYLVTLGFDTAAGQYDFVVRDQSQDEIVRVENIAFGNSAPSIERGVLYTSSGFVEDGFADDYRLRRWCGAEPDVVFGPEEQAQPPETVDASIVCVPTTGTVPFAAHFSVTLGNLYSGSSRRVAARVGAHLAGGLLYDPWRSGYTNLDPSGSFITTWNQVIPALSSVIGANVFTLAAEDVTPSPFNQPPYPPAGGTATDLCTVVAVAP